MSNHLRTSAASIAALILLSACVHGSGTGVPHLKAEHLAAITMDSVTPRVVSLSVRDARDPLPASSRPMILHVDHAARAMLARAGIAVEPGAANVLTLVVAYPESAPKAMKREDCIVMSALFQLANGAHVTSAGAVSCYTYKNMYGIRLANDPSGVYEEALNATFTGLDHALGGRN